MPTDVVTDPIIMVPPKQPEQPEQRESSATAINPVPMSFPAILRNKSGNDRFAHLHQELSGQVSDGPVRSKKRSRDARQGKMGNVGKRWVRRRENAHIPYYGPVNDNEWLLDLQTAKPTFPVPLPGYLRRSISDPSAFTQQPPTTSAGGFSMSLKGIRRSLRERKGRAEDIVRAVEYEILEWLHDGGTIFMPDETPASPLDASAGRRIGEGNISGDGIVEVSRNPLQLTWDIQQDSFARYVVHCCARYHNVVSYSKDITGRRLTYLLRPNVTRPDRSAAAGIATPPATESDFSLVSAVDDSSEADDNVSVVDSPIDHPSDTELVADIQAAGQWRMGSRLPSVNEDEIDDDIDEQTSALANISISTVRGLHRFEETTGVDADADVDDMSDLDSESHTDGGEDLSQSIASLDIMPPLTNACTPKPSSNLERRSVWDRRSAVADSRARSSPSPSPIQRRYRKNIAIKMRRGASARGGNMPPTLVEFVYG